MSLIANLGKPPSNASLDGGRQLFSICRKHREAFDILFVMYWARVHGFISERSRGESEATELAEQVMRVLFCPHCSSPTQEIGRPLQRLALQLSKRALESPQAVRCPHVAKVAAVAPVPD